MDRHWRRSRSWPALGPRDDDAAERGGSTREAESPCRTARRAAYGERGAARQRAHAPAARRARDADAHPLPARWAADLRWRPRGPTGAAGRQRENRGRAYTRYLGRRHARHRGRHARLAAAPERWG